MVAATVAVAGRGTRIAFGQKASIGLTIKRFGTNEANGAATPMNTAAELEGKAPPTLHLWYTATIVEEASKATTKALLSTLPHNSTHGDMGLP